jgi:hypothetical protein
VKDPLDRDQLLALERPSQRIDRLVRQTGQIRNRALAGLPALAPGFTQQHGGP